MFLVRYMNIAEQLLVLSEIGLIDQKIINQNIIFNKVPFIAKDASFKVKTLKKKKDTLLSQVREFELEIKCKENELEKEKKDLRKWLNRADRIRGEREYVALMSEINIKKKLISNGENFLLEKMLILEEVNNELIKTIKDYKNAYIMEEKEWNKIKEEMSILEKKIKKEKKIRFNLIEKLPTAIAIRYKKIFTQRGEIGVAFLECEICQCCKRMVPPELFLRVSKGEILDQCPSCQRLLVVISMRL